jgi:DNA-3-methyladenine glycosylase
MSIRLSRSFFVRDTRVVARELLGMKLVRLLPDGSRLDGIITETEAYRAEDAASHSYRGRTERNASMYLQPGTAYVYFTYGMHYCFNIVTEPPGQACAVLVRSLAPVSGIDVMRLNRQLNCRGDSDRRSIPLHDLCRGPARLCKALGIDRGFDGYNLHQRASLLFVEKGEPMCDDLVDTSSRIGVSGDEVSVALKWRWYIKYSPYVSGR